MAVPASKKGLKKKFDGAPLQVQKYFKQLPKLLEGFSLEVCIAYLFMRVERAHHMALYCGVVKIHQCNGSIASQIIEKQHITRSEFKKLFADVIGQEIPAAIDKMIEEATIVRNKAIHGKGISEADGRKAVACVIDYAELLNKFVQGKAGFKPFDDLRGFKGAGKSLSKSSTRWILKGIGFQLS